MKKSLYALFVALFSALAVLALQFGGALSDIEGRLDDVLVRLTAEPGIATEDVAVVLLDQASLDWAEEAMGLSWPWPRELYAALTQYLSEAGARAVGFDVIFSERSF